MKQTLIVFVCFLLSCIVLTSPVIAIDVKIYGDESYPPYSYNNNGKPAGIYVEIITKAFQKIDGYNLTIDMVPWRRGLNYIKTGKGAALFPPYFVKDREPWMLLSEPILPEKIIVFGKPEKMKGKTKWPKDFYESIVGMNAGYSPISLGTQAFKDAVDAGKIKLDDSAKDSTHNLKKLEAGRIDFYINDQMVDISEFKSISRGIEITLNNGYLGFTKQQENFPFIPDLKSKFDAVIKEMKTSGEIDNIVKSYKK